MGEREGDVRGEGMGRGVWGGEGKYYSHGR